MTRGLLVLVTNTPELQVRGRARLHAGRASPGRPVHSTRLPASRPPRPTRTRACLPIAHSAPHPGPGLFAPPSPSTPSTHPALHPSTPNPSPAPTPLQGYVTRAFYRALHANFDTVTPALTLTAVWLVGA